jgi:hypothetical protein
VQAIAALRPLRFTGPEIAEVLVTALSTVSGPARLRFRGTSAVRIVNVLPVAEERTDASTFECAPD